MNCAKVKNIQNYTQIFVAFRNMVNKLHYVIEN